MKWSVGLAFMLLASVGRGQDTSAVVHENIIAAPVAAVWRAWATAEGLTEWLAPHAAIDLRVGGTMRSNYDPQASLDHPETVENQILAFEPERMLALKVTKMPATFPFPHAVQRMWSVVYFEPVDAEQTRVRSVSLGFEPSEESQRMRAFFERGNAATLAKLQQHFAAALGR